MPLGACSTAERAAKVLLLAHILHKPLHPLVQALAVLGGTRLNVPLAVANAVQVQRLRDLRKRKVCTSVECRDVDATFHCDMV